MVHPNELDQQIENLRTLQQSYDQIAGAAEAYNVGKTQLAAAISSKGVETSPTESYPEMAKKVNAIPQETYEINGGEMYAKQLFGSLETPNYWNLYEVLAQLLSDGRLVNYGGILLAEYYRGYNSLALSGAGAGGAYVVSDKDEQGNFKMYTEDTTHTWATGFDERGNRWVAYCFADEYHDFQITDTNTSPRSIFIGRKVGTIKNMTNGRVSKIVVPDGNSLRTFNCNGYNNEWDKAVVIRNIESVNGYMFQPAQSSTLNIESLYIKADQYTYPAINAIVYNGSIRLQSYILECPNISSSVLINAHDTYGVNVDSIFIKTTTMNVALAGKNTPTDASNIFITGWEQGEFKIEGYGSSSLSFPKTKNIYIAYGVNDKTKSVKITSNSYVANLTNIELKEGWNKPINISTCVNLTEANMYAHILQRLKQDEPDCGDGVTITLGSTNLAKLTSQESVDLLDLLTNTYGYTFA